MRHFIILVSIILSMAITPVFAQDNLFDLRYELNGKGNNTYWNIIYARNFGPVMFEAFHVRLPQDDYKETVIGLGYTPFSIGDIAVYGLFHYSWAVDDKYLEPGIFAVDIDGRWTGSFWGVCYLPTGDEGIQQILIDPAEIQYNVLGRISVGISSYFWKPKGGEWFTKIGPKISISDKYGNTELRVANINNDGGWEFQLRRIVVF